jgi:AcrR family transcriptional regulator
MDGSVPDQPQRADARRNAQRLVDVATAAFAEHGPDASLIDIARSAGVGSATLYRHFPSREALLAAVYQSQIEGLAAEAYHLLRATASPVDALATWLEAFATQLVMFRGLKGLLTAGHDDRAELFAQCRQALHSAATAVLTAAQEAGQVRRDVDAFRLLKLISALVVANEEAGGPTEDARPLLGIVLDGLRYQRLTQL